MLPPEKKNQIRKLIKNWAKRKFRELKKLDPIELQPNPFLLRALGIKEESIEAYEFGIRQRLERSLVTSFGVSVFQEVLKILNSDPGIEDIDLLFEKEGIKYYVQLKSGPEGFTRPALRKTRQTFQKLKKENPNCKTVIAFAYGTEEQLSPVWGKEAKQSADLLLIGKDFWDFFFGEGTYEELLSLFEEVGKEVVREETSASGSLYETLVKILIKKVKKDKNQNKI